MVNIRLQSHKGVAVIEAQFALRHQRLNGERKRAIELKPSAMNIGEWSWIVGVAIQSAANDPALLSCGVHQLEETSTRDFRL